MRKLLYVEDTEDNLYMLRLRLDVLGGYEVLGAREGAAGIAMAASRRPDLILMDLDLPGIDGWEATRDDARFAALSAGAALKAALADPTALMVSRNAGSGTRVLIDNLLAGARPPGYANQPVSHNVVAAAIAQGRADWGIAIASVAKKMYGLAFLPICAKTTASRRPFRRSARR